MNIARLLPRIHGNRSIQNLVYKNINLICNCNQFDAVRFISISKNKFDTVDSKNKELSKTGVKGMKTMNITLNKRLVKCENIDEVLHIFSHLNTEKIDIKTIDTINLATCVFKLGSLGQRRGLKLSTSKKKEISKIEKLCISRIDEFKAAKGLVNVVMGFTKLNQCTSATLFEIFGERIKDVKKTLNPQEISNVVWAYSKLNAEDEKLKDIKFGILKGLESCIDRSRDLFQPQALANILWAYAKSGVKSKTVFDALGFTVVQKVKHFNAQDVSNTMWAYSEVGHFNSNVMQTLAEQSAKVHREYNHQNTVDTLHALTKFQLEVPSVYIALRSKIESQINGFRLYHLKDINDAFVSINQLPPKLVSDKLNRHKDIPQSDTVQKEHSISKKKTVKSVKRTKDSSIQFSKKINDCNSAEAILKLYVVNYKEFNDVNLSVCWKKLGKYHRKEVIDGDVAIQRRMVQLLQTCSDRSSQFNAKGIVNVLWGAATTQILDEPLCRKFIPTLQKKIHLLAVGDVIDVMWAISRCELTPGDYAEVLSQAIAVMTRKVAKVTSYELTTIVKIFSNFPPSSVPVKGRQLLKVVADESRNEKRKIGPGAATFIQDNVARMLK